MNKWLDILNVFYLLEVVIDYGSEFVTYGNEIESKGVQFPGRYAPDSGALARKARQRSTMDKKMK